MKPIFSNKQGVESARELNSEAKVVKNKKAEPEKKHSVYVPELRATIYTNNPDVSGVRNRYIKLYQMPEPVQDESLPEAVIENEPENDAITVGDCFKQPINTENPNIRISKSGKKYYRIGKFKNDENE